MTSSVDLATPAHPLDLARKIRRYIQRYNEDPKPIRWTYSNPAHRITTDSAVTVH